ncbi:MAG: glycosyltransferase family 4 protein [Saprospirales bacterium]|nr:glycosyltransferase family 4 protein [Saprospirales bacterium]
MKRIGADVFLSTDNYCSLCAHTPTAMVLHDIAYAHFPQHIPWLSRQYYRYFVPRYLNRAEQVITVSEFSRKDLVQTLGISPEKIQVGYNGPRDVFQPLPEAQQQAIRAQYSEGKPYFLYIGAIHPRKNVHRLIRAFDRFKAQTGAPHQLLLAGRWAWQTGEVRTAYEAARHKESIRFLGYVDDELLASVLGAAFALTYVSLWEGFGLPVLEALYAEVPVIFAYATSLPEVAGPAGLGVDPESEEAIASAMHHLVENKSLGPALVEKGRRQRTRFSWDQTAEVVYNVLEKISHPVTQ